MLGFLIQPPLAIRGHLQPRLDLRAVHLRLRVGVARLIVGALGIRELLPCTRTFRLATAKQLRDRRVVAREAVESFSQGVGALLETRGQRGRVVELAFQALHPTLELRLTLRRVVGRPLRVRDTLTGRHELLLGGAQSFPRGFGGDTGRLARCARRRQV